MATITIDLWQHEEIKKGFFKDWKTKDGDYFWTPQNECSGEVTARLIFSKGTLDFLADRKSIRGNIHKRIIPVFNSILKAIEELAKKEGFRFDNTSDNFAVGSAGDVVFIATPNQSYGYLYLTVVDTSS